MLRAVLGGMKMLTAIQVSWSVLRLDLFGKGRLSLMSGTNSVTEVMQRQACCEVERRRV